MALFLPGGVLGGGTISGKQGSIVFSRNASGAYVRNRVIPVNPNTTYQQAVRNRVGVLTSRWLDALTALQRAAWANYAANVPRTNRIGLPVNLKGLNWYIAMNSFRLQAGLPIQDTAPVLFTMATYTLPVPGVASQATQTISIAYTNSDDWALDGGAMSFYLSRPANPTVNYFKGPYRVAATVLGNTITPPTSPEVVPAPFPISQGQVLFSRINVTNPDGRIGAPSFFSTVVAA